MDFASTTMAAENRTISEGILWWPTDLALLWYEIEKQNKLKDGTDECSPKMYNGGLCIMVKERVLPV